MKQNYLVPIRGFLICLMLWSVATVAYGQKQITGTVTDSKGDVVPGATVTVKGTTVGVATDVNGKFQISVPAGSNVLVISSVGYKKNEINVNNQSNVNSILEDDLSALEEVVVTGYQTENRREITGAVSTVRSRDLTAVPSGNVEQQLQGKVAGVTVITNGQPGTESKVRVRGFGAFGGNEPLYVVDGVPLSSVAMIAPNDIENTTVLKDAAAASIYGARAANGVIVITTKKGTKKAQKMEVSYDGVVGTTSPGKGFSVMSPADQAKWTWIGMKNTDPSTAPSHPQYGSGATPTLPTYLMDVDGRSGAAIGTSVDMAKQKSLYNVDPNAGDIRQLVKANLSGTDWYGAITRWAPMNRHTLGFSGGTDHSRYYFGFSAQNQAGILIYNNFNRYTFRANSEFDLTKKFRIGENMQVTYLAIKGQEGGNGGQDAANNEGGTIMTTARMSPIIPVYDEFGGYAGTRAKGFNNPRNPVATRDAGKNNGGSSIGTMGNIYAEYDLIPGLTLRSLLGGMYQSYSSNTYDRKQYENSENNASFTYAESYGYSTQWNFTNTANYKKKLGMHSISAIVGSEFLNTGLGLRNVPASGRGIYSSGINPFSTDINFITLSNVGSKVTNSYYSTGVNMFSLFAKADYTYNDKYIVSATVRRDGSSNFGSNNRYGVFPAFSAAWRIKSEQFMQDIHWITDLKLRGGWGQMGNAINVPPANGYNLFGQGIGVSGYDITGSNSSVITGFYRSRIGNPNAKWETNTTSNVGFDATLLNGKFEVVLDYWVKNTKDLLFQPTVPAVIGNSADAPFVNVGAMKNSGLDLLVTNKGKIAGDWNYEVTLTGSFLKNQITALAPTNPYIDISAPRIGTAVRNEVGRSLSSFFGYQVVGLFQTQAEVDASKQDGAGLGRFKFKDVNGDGKINADDRTFLGSAVPKFTGGLNFTAKYKGFEVTTYFYTSLGNKIYNFTKWYTDFYGSFTGAAISTRAANSWSPTNTNTSMPIFESTNNFSTNTQSSSYYVENGSYLRMTNLQFAYNLRGNMLRAVHLNRAKVYVQTTNLFTITKYSGLDPAVGGSADTNFGMDVGNYPVTRAFNLGVSIGF